MGQRNYIELSRFPVFFRHYAFIDVPEHLADSLFIRHKVRVRFGQEYTNDQQGYSFIFCKIRKKDEKPFLEALGELSNKMMLCRHPDYDDFCQKTLDAMEEANESENTNNAKKQKAIKTDPNASVVVKAESV